MPFCDPRFTTLSDEMEIFLSLSESLLPLDDAVGEGVGEGRGCCCGGAGCDGTGTAVVVRGGSVSAVLGVVLENFFCVCCAPTHVCVWEKRKEGEKGRWGQITTALGSIVVSAHDAP